MCMTAALIGLRECAMRVFFQCPPPCSSCSGTAIRPRFHIARVHLGSAYAGAMTTLLRHAQPISKRPREAAVLAAGHPLD